MLWHAIECEFGVYQLRNEFLRVPECDPHRSPTYRHADPLRDTKVQLRMRPLQKNIISRAAELKQTTLTNLMVEHAFEAAQNTLADQLHFYLSPEKWNEFVAALDGPPQDLPQLRKLLTEPSVFDGPE